MLQCLICRKYYSHLGSHIYHAHGMFARDYKSRFGLDLKHALVTQEIHDKKSKTANWQKTWEKNFVGAEKYRFKKGKPNRTYFSAESKDRNRRQSKELLAVRQPCPVCRIIFNNVHTHLREKHNLKFIN